MNHPSPLDRTHATCVPPLYLTSTELGDTPNRQKMQNKPNFGPDAPQLCETNPISAPTPPNYAKRTQSQPNYSRFTTHDSLFYETNPILVPPPSS